MGSVTRLCTGFGAAFILMGIVMNLLSIRRHVRVVAELNRLQFAEHRLSLQAVVLAIADDGAGIDSEATGTGLSIVRALVRDELQGHLDLRNEGGTRAEVIFPA